MTEEKKNRRTTIKSSGPSEDKTNETILEKNPSGAQKQHITNFSEIFSLGIEIQGIAIHPVTSEIWAHEHGHREVTN